MDFWWRYSITNNKDKDKNNNKKINISSSTSGTNNYIRTFLYKEGL